MPDGPTGQIRDGIDIADVEESLAFLLETAEPAARAIAVVENADDRVRKAKAAAILLSDEKSQDRREADAVTSSAFERALVEREKAITLKVKIINLRRYHELRIEVWRSLNANHRQVKL